MFTRAMRGINQAVTKTPPDYDLSDTYTYLNPSGTGNFRDKFIPYMTNNQIIDKASAHYGIPAKQVHDFINITKELISPTDKDYLIHRMGGRVRFGKLKTRRNRIKRRATPYTRSKR